MSERIADRYEVIRPLGEGGLSRVILVRDTESGELRALKRVRLADPAMRDLVRNEYAALARIHHPNVVRVHEFGALPDGEAFFVMDYIAGRPLDEAVAPGDVASLLAVSLQVLDGLAAIHVAGLVHCDLKPDNLLVSTEEDGTRHVRIVDFGFAERRTEHASDKVRGTPGYAAPELLAGQPYSRDSDHYALGATFYRVLSGRAAFPGRDAASILASQRRGQPGVLALRAAGVPAALDAPLLGMLAPDPHGRATAVRAWEELARKRGHAPRADRRANLASGPFVGRKELLSLAGASLLAGGGMKAWMLVGPHGIGKTRLAREIALEAELAGRTVVWADADAPVSGERLARLGSDALLVFDDLDTWDEVDVAAASLARVNAPGLAILATAHRPPRAGDAIFRLLLTLPAPPAPDVRPLGPLEPGDVEQLVTALLGAAPPRGLPEQLVQAAGAAPGPLLDHLADLLASESLREAGGHWILQPSPRAPDRPRATARDAEEAWASLAEPARLAAVVQAGWPSILPASEMAEVAGIAEGVLRQGLDELAWRGFFTPARDERPARIAPRSFATYALREAGGDAVEALRRRMAASFDAMLTVGQLHASSPRAALLLAAAVQHLALGDPARARVQLREAFERARRSEASREVAQRASELLLEVAGEGEERCEILAALAGFESDENHGRRAEELWRELFDAGVPLAPAREFEWVLARAQNLQQLLDYGPAIELIRSALARLDNTCLPAAALGDAHGALGWSLQRSNRWAEAMPEFERAIELLPDDAVAERAIVLNRYGYSLCREGQTERGDAMMRDALALAQRSGDPRIEARVLGNLGGRATNRGDAAEGSRLTRAAMSLMTGAGSEQWQLVGASNLLSTANNACNWKEWDEAYALLEAAGRATGDPIAFSRACDILSDRCVRTGRLRDAIRANRMERQWLQGNTVAEFLVRNRIQRELLRGLAGHPSRACRRLRKLLAEVRTQPHLLVTLYAAYCLAELHLACGRRDIALRYTRFIERNSEGGIGVMTSGLLLAVCAAARGNDEPLFRQLLPQALAHCDRMAAAGARDVEPTRREIEAYRLAFAGEPDAAAAALDDAVAGYRALDLAPGVVKAAWAFGLLMVGRGALRLAIPALRQAHVAAVATGCALWRSQIAEDLLAASEALPDVGATNMANGKSAELLPSIIEMVNSLLDLPEMLRQALRVTCEAVGADRGFVLLLGEPDDELIEMAHFGLIDDDARKNSMQVSRTIVRWVTRRNETFQTSATGSDPRLGSTQSVLDVAIRSLVCVPLRLRERVIGTIYLETRAAGGQFSEPAVALVESFAHLIAVSIERSRLHDELRRSRDKVIGENLSLRREATRRFSGPNIIGQSREIETVLSEAMRVSATVASVLITGEPGTGKDLVARLIHYSSARADRPLLSFNCAALSKDLLDAELFGTEKQIATGVAARQGIFERADGATLFLDEIGEMPPELQSKLLRVLQSRTFTRVGGTREQPTDFRLLSATNRDLLERIEAGAFRDDLYERIRQFEIHIPPLRERRGDIPILAEHFLRQFCEANGRAIPRISDAFYAVIGAEPWLNNIRQLENYVVRCAILCEGDALDPVAPPPSKEPRKRRRPVAVLPQWAADDVVAERSADLKTALEEVERRWIGLALDEAKGNKRRAAAILGLNESTLRYRMGALGLEPAEQTHSNHRTARGKPSSS